MAINQPIQDPSTIGTGGLKGLNRRKELVQQGIIKDVPIIESRGDYTQLHNRALEQAVPQEVGFVGVGDSGYDAQITSMTQLENLANTRGELQPWYAQIGSGLAKGAVLAGTTLADGILGSIVGLGNAAATGTFSGFWDNPFSNAMQQVNEWSEQALPNYYTDAEKNSPWYDNIFTANFIGDKFLKNLGFAVGAYYAGLPVARGTASLMKLGKARQAFKGAVTASGEALSPSAVMQAYKTGDMVLDGVQLTEDLAKAASKLKMAPPVLKITGAFSGALGEARIESINNTKDWYDLHKQQLDDAQAAVASQEREALLKEFPQYRDYAVTPDGGFQETLTPEGEAMLKARVDAKFDYNGGLKKLAEDRAKMGNIDFLLNIPLLTVSDAWQFGKLYAGGFNTAKKASTILKTVAQDGTMSYAAKNPSFMRNAFKIASKGVAEGPYEEMGQSVAGKVAGYKYASELNDFYGAKIDPDAEEETIGWMQAMGKSIAETYGTAQGWEEGFIGGLTGLVGIPGFRGVRNAQGGIQSPIYMQGGVKEDISEIRKQNEQTDAIVTQLNNRVQSPEFLNYYQSAIRHNKYQRDMDEAADNNDNFEFKNAEHNQLINDVIMFDKAGRIQDLYDTIDEAGTVKPEDVEQIRQLTTNQETGTSVYDSMTDEEVVEQIQKQAKETKESIDKYREISANLQVKLGDYFDEDGLEEMTYYMSNIDNLEGRFKSIHSGIRERLQGILDAKMDVEFKSDSEENRVFKLSDLINMSPVSLINNIADSKVSQSYISALDKVIQNDPNKQDVIDQVNDLQRIAEKRIDFIDRYDVYSRNPELLAIKQQQQKDDVIKEDEAQKSAQFKEAVTSATDLNGFRKAIMGESSPEKRQAFIKELEDEGNNLAKDYRETETYNREMLAAISNLPVSPETKDGAMALLESQYNSSSNLEELANPDNMLNPEILYNEALSDEDNTTLFQNSEFALLTAMNIVNNDQRFKGRFPVEYLKPIENGKPGEGGKPVTGDSGTPTVDPVNPGPVDAYTPPAGDITPQTVIEENITATKAVLSATDLDNKQRGKRLYYHPIIPELHIEASKIGDFRPFNVVVAEREKLDFSEIYNYLRDNKAFSYVDEGKLKAGDELGFMVDPSFNDKTIFIIDRRDNQIVGSLAESENITSRYEGLTQLVKQIIGEYQKSGSKSRFIATPTTRVSQMMVGKIPYSSDEKNMNDIPGVSGESVFGIIKNGTLSTNDKIADNLITKPMDMSQKEGRMYVLIPNGAGKYSPAAVRVKHFNNREFNPSDVIVSSTPIYRNIREGIDMMANSLNNEDLSNAVSELGRNLYLGNVHIDLVSGARGMSIRLSKVERDSNGKEVMTGELTPDGKPIRKEDVRTVYLTSTEITQDGQQISSNRPLSEITNELQSVLQAFNLPLQVNLGMLNGKEYNDFLLSSGVLTSNITDASVKGTWFTTDYFDIQGNLQQALSPASVGFQNGRKVETPVGGKEGAIPGTPIELGTTTYYVDTTTMTIRDKSGRDPGNSVDKQKLFDLAYLQTNFGNAQNSATMIGGVALLPDGRIIDRNTKDYIEGTKAETFKSKLSERTRTKADSRKVVDTIAENQSKVDKTRTDSNYYYVMEEDGQYHPYDRVHTRLGSNWVESIAQTKALTDIRVNLSKQADNIAGFNTYLKSLAGHYKIDLSSFEGKIDAKSRDTIVSVIRDTLGGTNSVRALNAGTAIDSVIRNFFTSKDMPVRPDIISEDAFNNLISSLSEIKSNIEARGETFLTNNVVLFQKYPDGSRVAGEVDILSIDADGNFKIYDVKSSKYSFYDFTDWAGKKVNYFSNKSNFQVMSQKDYYTNQLSSYKNLFESQYHTPVTTLAILPFVLDYEGDIVKSIVKEKGIIVDYNSAVNVPLIGAVATPEVKKTDSSLPLFNSTYETQNPVNDVLPEYNMDGSKVGYYLRSGILHTGYLLPIGKINGIEMYMTKVPNITKGLGNEAPRVGSNDFYAVFPNGNTVDVIKSAPVARSLNAIKENMVKTLSGNPKRLQSMAEEKTIFSTPEEPVTEKYVPITPATVNQSEQRGAASSIQKEMAIQEDEDFEETYDAPELGSLRAADTERPVWNQEKELDWLKRVLPQLEENNLLRIQEGMIRVGKSGTLAWGQFNNGIVTLSDIAAEGTTYHEAFHVVFQLLTESKEREVLFDEAKSMYGELSPVELEEKMAEGFREYVITRESEGLGSRILNFFRNLFAKVTNWGSLKPSLTQYYRSINEGAYNRSDFKVSPLGSKEKDTGYSSLDSDTKSLLDKKGWTEDMWNSVSEEERKQALKCL